MSLAFINSAMVSFPLIRVNASVEMSVVSELTMDSYRMLEETLVQQIFQASTRTLECICNDECLCHVMNAKMDEVVQRVEEVEAKETVKEATFINTSLNV